jgi:hypothetical protein
MRENMKRVWTAEEDQRLLELRAAGRSPFSTAAALKRSIRAVTKRLSHLRAEQRAGAISPDLKRPPTEVASTLIL